MTQAAQKKNPAPREREPGKPHSEIIAPLPSNAQRIMRRSDLPRATAPASYDCDGRSFVFEKRCRQMLEALMIEPVLCASPVRLSPAVQSLRGALGYAAIETVWHGGGEGNERFRYGIYHLRAKVRRAEK